MNIHPVIQGAIAGVLVAVSILVIVAAAATFAALNGESTTSVAGIVEATYTGTEGEGFRMSIQPGPAIPAVVAAGALAGSLIGLRRRHEHA